MEVGNIRSIAHINPSHRAHAAELIIDTNEIKSILYLGIKGVNRRAAQAEEIAETSHTVDTLA